MTMKLLACRRSSARLLTSMCTVLALLPGARLLPTLAASSHPVPPRLVLFKNAARRSGVPLPVLIGLAFEQSRDSDHAGPSVDDGYGPLDLSARSDHDTLRAAAALLHISPRRLQSNDALNILAGALLLAHEERSRARGVLPRTPGAWSAAVISFTGMRSAFAAHLLLTDLFSALRHGISLPGVHLAPQPRAEPEWNQVLHGHLLSGPTTETAGPPDYPGAKWVPANYNNYTDAKRPADLPIRYIVIHDTEGSCASAVNEFQDAGAQASAHYVVCLDGTVIQMVHERDIAWHAGNWPINQEAIGIEHEGYWGKADYTRAQYLASAALVKYLCAKYHINATRNVIFGHENVPEATHIDPGPTWNWQFYMGQVTGKLTQPAGVARIADITTTAPIDGCPNTSCTHVGTANWGEEFAIIGQRPGWEKVDYGGQVGWIPSTAVTAGFGNRITTTAAVPLLAGPKASDDVIGTVPARQTYVSLTLDHGFWYIEYNHRYGFVSAAAVSVVHCRSPRPARPGPIQCAAGGSSATVTPSAAVAGTIVTVGTGRLTGVSAVTISAGGQVVGEGQTNAKGVFIGSFMLPLGLAQGLTIVTLADAAGHQVAGHILVESPIIASPVVSLPEGSVSPGSLLRVSGAGFPPLSTASVSVTFTQAGGQTQTVTVLTPTQPNGSLQAAPVPVPAQAVPGTYQLTVASGLVTAGASVPVAAAPSPTPVSGPSLTATPVG